MSKLATYVCDPSKAKEAIDDIARILLPNRGLPAQVFKAPYTCFAFFDYAVLQDARCWLELLSYANAATLVYLSPSAEDIWTRSQGMRYGIIQLGSGIENMELTRALSTSPTANPADAFVFGCMRCVVVVESRECTIFGDRYWDLAVAAFGSPAIRNRFRDFTPSWPFMAANDASQRVKGQSQPKDRSDFVEALKANYPNATPFS